MTDTTKVADLPAAWRRTAKAAGMPVAATFNACADELESALSQHPSAAGVPDGYVLVPAALAERVQDSLGRFTSDEGSAQADTDTSDDFAACVAAIQPVGQEPVAWIEARDLERLAEDDPEDPYAFEHVYPGPGEWGRRVPLYTAPPTPAVDLEQFRRPLKVARTSMEWARNDEAVAECARLLSLIDQQAGKGNDLSLIHI